jgi:hypothetical protein
VSFTVLVDWSAANGHSVALEGCMITLAVFALTTFHPGYCFPVLGAKQAQKYASVNRKSLDDESAVEMLPQRSTTPLGYNEHVTHVEPVAYAERGI